LKDYRLYTDKEIVRGVKNLDNQAFKAILYNRLSYLKKYILNNSGTEENVSEIEQRTTIIFFENVRDNKFIFSDKSLLSTYLFSIGKNQWLKELKKRKLAPHSLESVAFNSLQAEDTNFSFQENQDYLELRTALSKLDDTCKTLLVGKYYYKISDVELSREIGDLSIENVRKRRYKCLIKLRKIFKNKF